MAQHFKLTYRGLNANLQPDRCRHSHLNYGSRFVGCEDTPELREWQHAGFERAIPHPHPRPLHHLQMKPPPVEALVVAAVAVLCPYPPPVPLPPHLSRLPLLRSPPPKPLFFGVAFSVSSEAWATAEGVHLQLRSHQRGYL
jgi:hypothetical protein